MLFCETTLLLVVLDALLGHSGEHARTDLAERQLGADSLVVEAASNDGYLLKNFVEAGIPVLGIDPADGPAEEAQRSGVRSLEHVLRQRAARTSS